MKIVSREQWGARYADGSGPAPLPAKHLFLHHTTTRQDASPKIVEGIGQSRFRSGVSYTFLVNADGTVYEGHSINRRGTHTKGLNSTARAICAIGNYQTTEPSDALLASIVALVVYGHQTGWWPARITGGHRDAPGASTACPGDRLHRRIPELNRRIAALLDGDDDMTPEEHDWLGRVHHEVASGDKSAKTVTQMLQEVLDRLTAIEQAHGID